MVEIQRPQPGIVVKGSRPDQKGQDGETAHQETVLTHEHWSKWSQSFSESQGTRETPLGTSYSLDFPSAGSFRALAEFE